PTSSSRSATCGWAAPARHDRPRRVPSRRRAGVRRHDDAQHLRGRRPSRQARAAAGACRARPPRAALRLPRAHRAGARAAAGVLRAAAGVAGDGALHLRPHARRRLARLDPRQLRADRREPVRRRLVRELGDHRGRDLRRRARARRVRLLRAVTRADPRPGRAALRAAAAVLDRHRHRSDGADVPADHAAGPHRHPPAGRARHLGRHPAHRDLHPQGLHGLDPAVLRGVRPPLRGEAVADPARRRRADRAAGAGVRRGVDARAGVGQLPRAVPADPPHPAAARRGADVHLLHRGRAGGPAAAVGVRADLLRPDHRHVLPRQPPVRVPVPRRDQELMAAITTQALVKEYPGGVRGVDGVDVTIADGEFFALLGPSGCGKTTLLRSIAGLETITEGTLIIGDRDVTRLEPGQRGVAMVFQDYALFPHMDVADNIAYPLKIRREPRGARRAVAKEVGDGLSLTGLLQRRPGQLSGGQQQRVALARAVATRPEVLLLDEPLSNLDARLRLEARTFLKELQRELGVTTVFVTHDQAEALALADRIAVMREGKLQQVGTPREVFATPATTFVAGFIGSTPMNLLPARVEGGRVRLGEASVPVPRDAEGIVADGAEVVWGARPEYLGW